MWLDSSIGVRWMREARQCCSAKRSTAQDSGNRMSRMSRNEEHDSNRQEPTLDPFARASGERLTGEKSERLMEEADAAALPGRRSTSSSAVMAAAARSRFACSSPSR